MRPASGFRVLRANDARFRFTHESFLETVEYDV